MPKCEGDRRKASAAHARKALQQQRQQRRRHADVDERKIQAVELLFQSGWLSSGRHLSRSCNVSRPWLERLVYVGADWSMQEEVDGFMDMLHDIEKAKVAGNLLPLNFVWARMYDESPFLMKTDVLTHNGTLDEDASVAKVMGSKLRFAFAFLRPGRGSAQSPDAHIIRGAFSSRFVALTSMHASKVLKSIRDTMSLPPRARPKVEGLFPRCGVAINADLHPSNNAAERQEQKENPRWPSALWRCSFHRTRTGESRTLALDSAMESFLFNVGHTLCIATGAWKH